MKYQDLFFLTSNKISKTSSSVNQSKEVLERLNQTPSLHSIGLSIYMQCELHHLLYKKSK